MGSLSSSRQASRYPLSSFVWLSFRARAKHSCMWARVARRAWLSRAMRRRLTTLGARRARATGAGRRSRDSNSASRTDLIPLPGGTCEQASKNCSRYVFRCPSGEGPPVMEIKFTSTSLACAAQSDMSTSAVSSSRCRVSWSRLMRAATPAPTGTVDSAPSKNACREVRRKDRWQLQSVCMAWCRSSRRSRPRCSTFSSMLSMLARSGSEPFTIWSASDTPPRMPGNIIYSMSSLTDRTPVPWRLSGRMRRGSRRDFCISALKASPLEAAKTSLTCSQSFRFDQRLASALTRMAIRSSLAEWEFSALSSARQYPEYLAAASESRWQ